jgi:hypothetical protein
MLQGLRHKNKSNKSQRHSIFQTPIHNQPNNLTWKFSGGHGTATNDRPKRQHPGRQRDSGSTKESEQTFHQNSQSKGKGSKGKRAAKQNTNSPRRTLCHTTSKGGRAKSKGGTSNSKGGQSTQGWLSCSTDCYKPNRIVVRRAVPHDTFSIMVTAVGRAVPRGLIQLHLTGQRKRWRTTRVQHLLTNDEHHAWGNVGMCWHLQANIYHLTGPWSAKLQRETSPSKYPPNNYWHARSQWRGFVKWPTPFLERRVNSSSIDT